MYCVLEISSHVPPGSSRGRTEPEEVSKGRWAQEELAEALTTFRDGPVSGIFCLSYLFFLFSKDSIFRERGREGRKKGKEH